MQLGCFLLNGQVTDYWAGTARLGVGALRLHRPEATKPLVHLPFCLEGLPVPRPSPGPESYFTDGETEAEGIPVSSLEAWSWTSVLLLYNRKEARPRVGCRGTPTPVTPAGVRSLPFVVRLSPAPERLSERVL